MSQNTHYDFIVVGGGVVGLLAAITLSKLQGQICLIEKRELESVAQDRRVVALNLASVNVLKHLDLWEEVVAKGPIKQMVVCDHMADGCVSFDLNQTTESELGFIVEQQSLLRVLLSHLERLGVRHYFGQSIAQFDPKGSLRLSSGAQLSADLMLGADGVNSFVREQTGIATSNYDYQQAATVATLKCEKPHHQTAYQFFHASGPVALLPLQDSHLISLVWSISHDAQNVQTDATFCQSLYEHVDGVLGEMTLESPRKSFPLKRMHAKSYWQDKCVLLGDAAHMIHPLAGQGLNLGFMDVATLYDVLSQWHAQGKVDLSRYLNRYQRQRRAHASLLQGTMDAFHFGFKSRKMSLISLRNWGLNRVNSTQFLKKRFMDVALGKIGFTIPFLGRNYHGRSEHSTTSETNPIF